MSWLARSIANTLHLDDGEQDAPAAAAAAPTERIPDDWHRRLTLTDAKPPVDTDPSVDHRGSSCTEGHAVYRRSDGNQTRGVKEDLSELRDSLKRQLWGVASFLAPPPTIPPPPRLSGHRSGFFEPVSEPNAADSDDDDFQANEQHLDLGNTSEPEENNYNDIIRSAMGITEEVLAFASNIAHHPESWLDFPLSEEEEFDDFEISDAQYKHLLAMELLAPRLAALRIELCPVHMSQGYFWMVYFVLLHSRLNKHDADLLSSPQLVEARLRWMKELQKQRKELENSFLIRDASDPPREYSLLYEDYSHQRRMTPFESSSMHQASTSHDDNQNFVTENPATGLKEKGSVAGSSSNVPLLDDTDDDDSWLKEDPDLIGYAAPSMPLNEEDISFSDLEDDLDSTMPVKYRTASSQVNLNSKPS